MTKVIIHRSVIPNTHIGDTLRFDDNRMVDIIAEGSILTYPVSSRYFVGRYWPWHKYIWKPIAQKFIWTYCTVTGRKWYT